MCYVNKHMSHSSSVIWEYLLEHNTYVCDYVANRVYQIYGNNYTVLFTLTK